MATIDSNIAMGYRPIQLENPLNQLAAVSQIQGNQQGQQLNALKMRQAQQEFNTQNALAEAYKGAFNTETGALDYNLLTRRLAEGGAGSAIPTVLKTRKEAEQAEALLGKTKVETRDAKQKLLGTMSRDLSRSPTDSNLNAHFEDLVSSGLFSPQEITIAQAKRDQLLAMPLADRIPILASQGATAGDLKPTLKDTDIGGSIIPRVFDAYSGTQISQGTPIVKTPTIADKISQARLNLEQDKVLREQTMGTIPAGYRLNKDTKELEAIPGGPTTVPLAPKELQAREAKFPQATTALKTFDSTSDNLIKDLERLKNHPGLSNITGVIAGRTPSLTAQGREAQALYDKIIARGGFQELQSLRQSSPTGGALGNVSNQEGQSLRQAFGALDRTQDASSIRNEIDRLVENIGGAKTRVREAFDMTYDYKNTTPRSNAAAPTNTGEVPSLNEIFNPKPKTK